METRQARVHSENGRWLVWHPGCTEVKGQRGGGESRHKRDSFIRGLAYAKERGFILYK